MNTRLMELPVDECPVCLDDDAPLTAEGEVIVPDPDVEPEPLNEEQATLLLIEGGGEVLSDEQWEALNITS